MPYLEASTDMNDDHDLCHTDDPYRVAQGVHDLATGLAAKGMVPSKAHSKVAVCNKSVRNPHTKLQRTLVSVCLCVHRHVCEKKRKDYAFRRQFNEKPSIIPGCPDRHVCACVRGSVHVCI